MKRNKETKPQNTKKSFSVKTLLVPCVRAVAAMRNASSRKRLLVSWCISMALCLSYVFFGEELIRNQYDDHHRKVLRLKGEIEATLKETELYRTYLFALNESISSDYYAISALLWHKGNSTLNENALYAIMSKLDMAASRLQHYSMSLCNKQHFLSQEKKFGFGPSIFFFRTDTPKDETNTITVLCFPTATITKFTDIALTFNQYIRQGQANKKTMLEELSKMQEFLRRDVLAELDRSLSKAEHNHAIILSAEKESLSYLSYFDFIRSAVISVITALITVFPFVYSFRKERDSI